MVTVGASMSYSTEFWARIGASLGFVAPSSAAPVANVTVTVPVWDMPVTVIV